MSIHTMILAPHIDDEVLGCFTFLSSESAVLWFGVEQFHEVSITERLNEAAAVANTAGFHYELLEHPVNRYQIPDLLPDIEAQIAAWQPETLLLPRPSYHQDHRAVFEAGFTACRPHDRLPPVARVLVYDQLHATLHPRDPFQANLFRPVDMTHKLALWHLHRSQNRGQDEHLLNLARLRGLQSGMEHAEAFQVLRWIMP